MKIPYKDNFPVASIRVIGKGQRDIDAHIDFAASKTVIPSYVAEELELRFAGFQSVATGAGVILMSEYEAEIEVFDSRYKMLVGSLDLPAETPIKALLGRDVLDRYKICLNGKTKEIEITNP